MNDESLAKEVKNQLIQLLDQSMDKLTNCLEQLDEKQIWWRPQSELNSIGNLLLHICGNLRQWSTTALTDQPDDRDREHEFSSKHTIPKSELVAIVNAAVQNSKRSIVEFPDSRLLDSVTVQGFPVSYLEAITHTCAHFQGHTHQVIMLTRLQLGSDYRMQWSPEQGRDSLPM